MVAVNDHSYEWPLSDPSVRNPSVRSMARRSSIEACHESLVGEVLDLAEVSLATLAGIPAQHVEGILAVQDRRVQALARGFAAPVWPLVNAARLARAEAVLSSPSLGGAGAKVTFRLMWPRLRLEGAPGDAEGHGVPDRHVPAWNTSLRFGRSPECSYPSFVSCSSAAAGGSALKMPRSSMTCCPSRLRM